MLGYHNNRMHIESTPNKIAIFEDIEIAPEKENFHDYLNDVLSVLIIDAEMFLMPVKIFGK